LPPPYLLRRCAFADWRTRAGLTPLPPSATAAEGPAFAKRRQNVAAIVAETASGAVAVGARPATASASELRKTMSGGTRRHRGKSADGRKAIAEAGIKGKAARGMTAF
jgi:hypothetical protein